jgi:DNA-binding NarL/FixJ family response regulator
MDGSQGLPGVPASVDRTTSLQILVADSHHVIRRMVRTALEVEPTWTVCAEAASGLDALAKATEFEPDVIVLEVGLHGLTAAELTRKLRDVAPRAHVVALTMHSSRQLVQRLSEAGARACVPKADVGRSLVNAIKSLLGIDTPAHDAVPDELPTDVRPEEGGIATGSVLTTRERQVMQLLAEGRSNKEVASLLAISAKTVETYRARIMGKLGLRSMNHLVRYAIRHRIITA